MTLHTGILIINPDRGGAAGSKKAPAHIAYPSPKRKARLIAEIAMLYLVMPVVTLHLVLDYRLPLFTVLPALVIVYAAFLLADERFSMRRELTRGMGIWDLIEILVVFVILGGLVAYAVSLLLPSKFLSMPLQRPEVWQRVMIFYPLLSVIPQELAYRTFFFHRYFPLFGRHRRMLYVTNGMLFGIGHIVFANWFAVISTALIGMLFAYRYHRTESFWAVCLEHTLWGWLVFTVGLGGFFFTGVAFQGDFPLSWIRN